MIFALAFMAVATIFVLAARSEDDVIVLSRNEVVQVAAGGRIWRGAMMNLTDRPYQDVSVAILFRDQDGMPVGWTSAQTDHLAGGESLDLETALPAEASDMQMYALRWSDADHSPAFGPYKPWPFGYLQHPLDGTR